MPELDIEKIPFDLKLLEDFSDICKRHGIPVPVAKWEVNVDHQLSIEVGVGQMVRELRTVRAPGGRAEWNEALIHAMRHVAQILDHLSADHLLCRDQRCRMFGRRHEETPHETASNNPYVRWWEGEHPDDKTAIEPVFEWRVVAECGRETWESNWTPYTGPEDEVETVELAIANGRVSLGLETAQDISGFGYAVQVRRIGETS